MTDKFIDKTRLDADNTTNVTGLVSAIGAITGAIDGISHGRPVGVWLPMVFVGLSGAIAQWLQGSPSQGTKLISSILRLEEAPTNAVLLRNIFDRILDSGAVPGAAVVGDVSPETERRRSDVLDPIPHWGGHVPEWSDGGTPTRLDIRAQAHRAADIARGRSPIEGTDMYPSQFTVLSQPGDDFDDVTQG